MPKHICPLGLARAQWAKDNTRYTEEMEATAPGCPYGMLTPDSGSYCMFKMAEMSSNDSLMSYEEIAHALSLSVDQVKQAEKSALEKIAQQVDLKRAWKDHLEDFNESTLAAEDHDIYFPESFFSSYSEENSDGDEEITADEVDKMMD